MMRAILQILIVIAIASALPLQSVAQIYDMTLATKPSRITLGEPVTLEIAVQNLTQETRHFEYRDSGTMGMQIVIKGPSGKELEMVSEILSSTFDGHYRRDLKSGEVISFPLLISERFNLTSEGAYAISVNDRMLNTSASSNFVILAADAAALQRRCEELLERTRSTNAQQALFAARSLAAIRNPIVIPFLHQMASSINSPMVAIDALARFGSVQAVDALNSIYRRRNPSSLEAKAVLDRLKTIQRVTEESTVRERVRSVLSAIDNQ